MKVDSTPDLLNALRSQLASRAEGLRTATDKTGSSAAPESQSAPVTIEELRRRIGRELGTLNLELPANRRRARTVFIECVLTWEFGDALLNDPQLGFFVRDIDDSLESNPKIAAALDEVLMYMHEGKS